MRPPKLNHAQRIVVALVVPALVLVGLYMIPFGEIWDGYCGDRLADYIGFWLVAVVLVGAFELWLWRSRPNG